MFVSSCAVLKARDSEAFLDFDNAHFSDSALERTTPVPPVKPVFYDDPYSHMEASIEDRLDRDDIQLMMDMNRHDEELTGTTRGKSYDIEHESHDTGSDSDRNLDAESHTELTQIPDQVDGNEIVFTDVVEDKKASESNHSSISQEKQGFYRHCVIHDWCTVCVNCYRCIVL